MIESYVFGSMRVAGALYVADLKIIDGRVAAHWWRKAGHVVDVGDVDDILAAHPRHLVVGMGQPGMMRVAPALRSALAAARVELIEVPTAEAVGRFNALHAAGEKVAGAFHLTC
jgi:hypothetical protein